MTTRYHNGPAVADDFAVGWAIASAKRPRRAHLWRVARATASGGSRRPARWQVIAYAEAECGVEYEPTAAAPLVVPGDAVRCQICAGSPTAAAMRRRGEG